MKLYYYPVCPISNKLRLLLHKIEMPFEGIKISSKQSKNNFLNFPVLFLPILESDGIFYRDITSILDLILKKTNHELLKSYEQEEKIQYFEAFFDKYMFFDIYKNAIFEKTQKLILYNEYFPDNNIIKIGINYIKQYLDIIENALSEFSWINVTFSINDISGFAFLATMDYCFLVPWVKYPNIKQWYRKMKSQKSFNFILEDRINNLNPPSHYQLIEF